MRLIIQNTAHSSIENLFEYLANYSIKNAMETIDRIYEYIYCIKDSPYIGKCVPKVKNKHFRELICKKYKNLYRIIYYISETTNTIYILYIASCKQDFYRILKLHNYFNNFLEF